jgi:predicted histone-like DNA-binding protein
MYAKYDFRKKPSSKEDEDEQPLYPRIVSNGTIDFQQIVKEIAQASSFTPADIEGVQLAIENKISEYLVSGHHVQLGNLGYFSAKLKARPVMDAKEIHAQSIYFDNVNFRPSSSFRKKVRGFVEKAKTADGFVFGSPVHYASASGMITSFLDRAFYGKSALFQGKPGACIVSCRRGGASAAFDQLNKYFTINCMPVVSSQYWNQVHGNTPEEVKQDLEGMQTMRTLGNNMAWLLKCIAAGKAAGVDFPEREPAQKTNFIR